LRVFTMGSCRRANTLRLDAAELARYREGYRHVAYVQASAGAQVRRICRRGDGNPRGLHPERASWTGGAEQETAEGHELNAKRAREEERMDRREFLKQSAITATALSASLGTLLGASHYAAAQKAVAELDGARVRNFASQLRGQALLPSDAGYETACRNWIGGIPKRPGLVVLPAEVEDVAAVVRFAREHELALAVRGGGHTTHSTTDGGVMVNLTSLQKVAIDPVKRLLRVDAGLTGGAVDKATSAYGLATIMGECPSVGLSGLALGGGLGRLMGQHGALCDNLVSAEVVSAEGKALRVSADENADLFWATRGGGGNFGIVTSFAFRLHPVGQVLSGVLHYPISRIRETLQFFGRYMETAPDQLDAVMEIGSGFLLYVDHRVPAIAIHVTCGGDLRAAERALQPLRAFGPPSSDTIRVVSYFEAQAMGNFTPSVMRGTSGAVSLRGSRMTRSIASSPPWRSLRQPTGIWLWTTTCMARSCASPSGKWPSAFGGRASATASQHSSRSVHQRPSSRGRMTSKAPSSRSPEDGHT